MNYTEFRETYKKLLKASPDVSSLYTGKETEPKNIEFTSIYFKKSGSRWVETEHTQKMIDCFSYCNMVDPAAIQFFKGLGGYEKVTKGYTKRGCLSVTTK